MGVEWGGKIINVIGVFKKNAKRYVAHRARDVCGVWGGGVVGGAGKL